MPPDHPFSQAVALRMTTALHEGMEALPNLELSDAKKKWGWENFGVGSPLCFGRPEYNIHFKIPFPDPKASGWLPWAETVESARRRLQQDFDQRLEAYTEICRQLATSRGSWPKARTKTIERDLKWLAIYQARPRLSYDGLREYLNQEPNVAGQMSKQIPKAADLIGLPRTALKQSHERRPPKTP